MKVSVSCCFTVLRDKSEPKGVDICLCDRDDFHNFVKSSSQIYNDYLLKVTTDTYAGYDERDGVADSTVEYYYPDSDGLLQRMEKDKIPANPDRKILLNNFNFEDLYENCVDVLWYDTRNSEYKMKSTKCAFSKESLELLSCAEKNDLKCVSELIAEADVNVQNYLSYTPLIFAVKNRNEEMVKQLLSKNPDVNIIGRDEDGSETETALYAAVQQKAATNEDRQKLVNIVKLLLDAKADVSLYRGDLETFNPLYFAVRNGHTEIVKLLIAAGADVNVSGGHHIDIAPPPLRYAGHSKEMVEMLLAAGAKPFFISTPDKEIIKLLIAAGVKPDASALDSVIFSNYIRPIQDRIDIVKLLIEAGADVNGTDKFNNTPLMQAGTE